MTTKKMIHEQEFEKYGIDPQKVYSDGKVLKQLEREWIPEIILQNINSIKISRTHQNIDKKEKVITLGFESVELLENFNKEFSSNLFQTINQFLINKGLRPTDYNRILVFEIVSSGMTLSIRY